MKKFLYYFLLTITVLAATALIGTAFWFAVIRPDSNYHLDPGQLPSMGFPDLFLSGTFLLFAAPVCFVGSFLIRLLNYDDQKKR